MFPSNFWQSSIWKEAARAGLRQISRMVSEGNLTGASQLAKTPGVLNPSRAGSQIQHLGRGGEGVATLVAHPDHGVAVRKLYDPRGISGSEMIARKEQAGKALNNNPNFARFMGADQTPFGGQMHFNEYIKPGQAPTGNTGLNSIRKTEINAHQGLSDIGFPGSKDIHSHNMIYDSNKGQHRVVDYIPGREGEFLDTGNQGHLMPTHGSGPLNENYEPNSGTTGGMLGRLLGGKSSPSSTRKTDPMTSIPNASNRTNLALGSPKPVPSTQAVPSVGTATAVLKKPTAPSTSPMAPATVKLKKPEVMPPTTKL